MNLRHFEKYLTLLNQNTAFDNFKILLSFIHMFLVNSLEEFCYHQVGSSHCFLLSYYIFELHKQNQDANKLVESWTFGLVLASFLFKMTKMH